MTEKKVDSDQALTNALDASREYMRTGKKPEGLDQQIEGLTTEQKAGLSLLIGFQVSRGSEKVTNINTQTKTISQR